VKKIPPFTVYLDVIPDPDVTAFFATGGREKKCKGKGKKK